VFQNEEEKKEEKEEEEVVKEEGQESKVEQNPDVFWISGKSVSVTALSSSFPRNRKTVQKRELSTVDHRPTESYRSCPADRCGGSSCLPTSASRS